MKGTNHRVGNGWLIGVVLILVMPLAEAELVVIFDSGHTTPISPLLAPLHPSLPETTSNAHRPPPDSQPPQAPQSSQPPLGAADLTHLLPLRSAGLTPGVESGAQVNRSALARLSRGNPRPFFMVGANDRSLQWLHRHRERLKKLGAVGLLVQADTLADLQRVAEVANGVPMTLGDGSDIAANLGIRHYPVLITRAGIAP